jgi:hypothetical protein
MPFKNPAEFWAGTKVGELASNYVPPVPYNLPNVCLEGETELIFHKIARMICQVHSDAFLTGPLNLDDLWLLSKDKTITQWREFKNLGKDYKSPYCGRVAYLATLDFDFPEINLKDEHDKNKITKVKAFFQLKEPPFKDFDKMDGCLSQKNGDWIEYHFKTPGKLRPPSGNAKSWYLSAKIGQFHNPDLGYDSKKNTPQNGIITLADGSRVEKPPELDGEQKDNEESKWVIASAFVREATAQRLLTHGIKAQTDAPKEKFTSVIVFGSVVKKREEIRGTATNVSYSINIDDFIDLGQSEMKNGVEEEGQ